MIKFSRISHYRLKNGIRLHWTLLSVILMQLLLCSARPDQYDPNPDGLQVRHVPAKNKIHTEPIPKQTLTKREVIEETAELPSQTTTNTNDSNKDTENSNQAGIVNGGVIRNNMNDTDNDDDLIYEEEDKVPYPQTYPETKQSSTTTAKITQTIESITVPATGEFDQYPIEESEDSTFADESTTSVITSTSLTPDEIVSEESPEKPVNSDHFIENISEKNDSSTKLIELYSGGFRQSYEVFTLLIPIYLYLF